MKKLIKNCIVDVNNLVDTTCYKCILEKNNNNYKDFLKEETLLKMHEHDPKTCIKDGDVDGYYFGCLEIRATASKDNFRIYGSGANAYIGELPKLFYANVVLDIRYRESDDRVYACVLSIQFLRSYEHERYQEDYSFLFKTLAEQDTLEERIKDLLSEKNIDGQSKYRYSFKEIAMICEASYYKVSSINSVLKVR